MGHQLPINDGVFQVISPSVAPRQVGGWALTTAMSALFATVMAGEPDGQRFAVKGRRKCGAAPGNGK